MHASQPPPLRVAAAQCLQGSDRTTSPQNGGQLPGVTPGWAWPGQRARDGGRGRSSCIPGWGGLPRPQADHSPAGSQWEGGERSSWVPPCRSPRPQPLGPRRDAGRGLCARGEAAATRPGSGPTPSTCRGSSCSGPGGLVLPSTPRGFAAPAATPEQTPARSLHLSVREKGWGVGPTPPTTKRPPRRGRGRGTGRWTSERVIRMHRTSSGKCKLKQQRATAVARQDHGQSPQRRRHRPPARTRGHESPHAPPAGCRRCPARDAVWGRWIQRALAEGPGGRAPRRLFAQRLNAGVRRRLQQLFS